MQFVHLNCTPESFGLIFDDEPDFVYPFSVGSNTMGYIHDTYNYMFNWLMSKTPAEIKEAIGKNPPVPVEEAAFYAAIPRPIHDVICVGLNYKDHVEECHKNDIGSLNLETPTFFSKRASRIYTHGDTLPSLENVDDKLDYEVELAVIIGKGGKNIPKEEVKNHILGYAVYNDFSARTVQKSTTQWFRGKSLDGLSAMSSSIVLAKDLPFPLDSKIKCYVNGELRQESTTNNVSNSVDTLISLFSQGTTLEAGDIFITGTPAGVAMGMENPVYLKSGDVVRCEIEGVGELTNIIG